MYSGKGLFQSPTAALAEGQKAFKWLDLQKAFSEAFKVLSKVLKG
jgi:hypothetical protein